MQLERRSARRAGRASRRSRGRRGACRARSRACRARAPRPCARAPTTASATSTSGRAGRRTRRTPSGGRPPPASPRSRAQGVRARSPSRTSLSVSPRRPRRSVSSGMTSSGGMFPRLTFGPEVLDEPGLRRLRRRLEDQVAEVDLVRDLVDEAGAHLAGRPEDAGGAALAALGDHLPGAGLELLLDPLHPLVRREDDLRVLRADLGEDGEVAREVGDQLELALARDLERAVGDLDVREALLVEPAP